MTDGPYHLPRSTLSIQCAISLIEEGLGLATLLL